jgi:hypothetical protein
MLIGSGVEAAGVEAMRTGTSTVFRRVTKRKRRFGTKEKNDEAAILGVDAGILQRAAAQSAAGPDH